MGGLGNAHHAVLIAAYDADATSFLVFSRMAEEKRATMLLKLRKMGAGRMEINAGHVRRGIQFLVNIGTPLVVVALRGGTRRRYAVRLHAGAGRHCCGLSAFGGGRVGQPGRRAFRFRCSATPRRPCAEARRGIGLTDV